MTAIRNRSGAKAAVPAEPFGRGRPDVRTLPERLAELIRHAIFDGSIAPGQALRQADLAERFGVSRIPLREALRQLEAEGLVEFSPYRGATVATLHADELEDLAEIRRVLDSRVLRLACRNFTPELGRELEEILDARDLETDPLQWGHLHNRFYSTLFAAAGRPHLVRWILQVHAVSRRYFAVLLRSTPIQRLMQRNTRRLLEVVRRGDADEAVRALEEHYRAFTAKATILLRELEQPAAEAPPKPARRRRTSR